MSPRAFVSLALGTLLLVLAFTGAVVWVDAIARALS